MIDTPAAQPEEGEIYLRCSEQWTPITSAEYSALEEVELDERCAKLVELRARS